MDATKGPVENSTTHEEIPSSSAAMAKTTTISTIAVQSGKTRIVIALLHCGDWISLKILEITPELTTLGNTLEEAIELQKAHDEVLRQLQNKQSPVEELLRQADQLIATQKPRAEVYAAMAESLGRAWKDINSTLELRKLILDLNVLYHKRAEDFFQKTDALEASCKEKAVPIDIDAVKEFLTVIHEQRRTLLESLMLALQAGNSLLGKLKELGAEGTLDSRPDRIRNSVKRAISQVQGWLDELHLRRQFLEVTFNSRKTQLEQCLALAILATDLRELEETVQHRRNLLANSNQYGDSSSSAELFLHEHKKLLPEAQQLQERALKITKATEQLVASGCFAGEQATQQSYAVLSSTSDYLTDLQNRESLLERVKAFFRTAQTVLTKLNQLEMQLTATELPKTSPQLAQLHEQCSKAIEDATSAPIAEGYAILDAAGSGTEGIQRMVEELENKKIILEGLCTAHKEENVRVNAALNNFLEKHNEIYSWLLTIAEAFLKGHRDMGSDLPLASDFYELHNQLLNDLQTKGNEINTLLLTLPPILEYLEDNQRKDIDVKVEQLHERWMKLKNILEMRMELASIYVKFHTEADIVNKEMNKLDNLLAQNRDKIDDETMKRLEEKFEAIVPYYNCAKNTGLTFINQAKAISEPNLDTQRACLCVESVLERLSGRQLVVTRNWQTFHTEVVEKRELLVRLELTMEESSKTISLVSKLENKLYPIITTDSNKSKQVADYIEEKLTVILPDIRKAQADVNEKIKTTENLIQQTQNKDQSNLEVKEKLEEISQKLQDTASDYQVLSQVLIGYFRNLEENEKKVEVYNAELEKTGYPKDVSSIDKFLQEHEVCKQTIGERLRFAQTECDQVADRIRKQEPEEAAEHDVNRLKHVLELNRAEFENQWRQRQDSLLAHRQISSFDYDLNKINDSIDDLDRQIKNIKGQYGESVSSAKATSQSFGYLEETVQTLEQRIQSFIKSSEKLIAENHKDSSHVQNEIAALQDRWNNLKNQLKTTRSLIDTSIHYFQFVEKADEWFREGSKLLVTIARKSTSVKRPEEAEELLNEVSQFLTPGEEKQNERIENISELAVKLYGQDQSKYAPVIVGNREMLDSFESIIKELNTLAENLRQAEEDRQRLEREKSEAKLAEEAKQKAEAQRKDEEKLAEEARKAEEAKLVEERRKAEEARLANEARIAKEKIKAEELRIAEEKRKIEEARIAEEARLAEERRKAEETKQAEEAKLAEERQKILEEKQKLEKAKAEEEIRRAEEAKLAEARRAEEARLAEEKRKLEEAQVKQRKEAERLRLEEERQKAEQAKLEQKKNSLEITEITDIQKIEIQNASNKRIPSPIPIVEDASEIPVFTSPLSDAVIQEGNKFTFICRVTGHPTPIIHWYKAGISIQNNPDYRTSFENGLCTLTIEETFAEDSARYTCRATNQAGEDETSAVLSVKESQPEEVLSAPYFVKLLQPSVAKEGSTFQFECQVDGNPLPTVQWFKNSDCIDNSSDYGMTYNNGLAFLKFEKVGLDDKAEYTCKASNQLGTAQSTANLIVTPSEPAEAPAFITPLSNVMARAGQKIKLECEISGLPPPTLAWSHNGKTVKETREIKLQQEGNKGTLLVFEAFPKDAGTYAINAKNLAGEATSSCSVSVKGRLPTETSDSEIASDMEPIKPSVQLPLTNTSAKEGSRVRLDCVIVGQPEPEVIWYHGDQPVKESQDFQLLFQGDRCSLIILEVLPEDAGEYKVVALNSAGEASSKCVLSVTESDTEKPQEEKSGIAPKFSKLLADVLVSEGDKVILEGIVIGKPKPEIKWLLNNLPVTDTEHFILSYDNEGNVRLEIDNVKPEDKGVYTVKALNSVGEAKCFAQLIVKSFKPTETVQHDEQKQAPDFKEGFSDRSVPEESSTKFECIIIGKPTPKVRWLFNGEQISGKDFLISTSGNRQVLSIPIAKQEHSGTVTCVAENEVGKATCIANLQVQPSNFVSLQDNQLEILPSLPLSTEKSESSYKISREVVTQSSTSHTSKIISTNSEMTQPHVEEHRVSSQKAQTFKQINQDTPDVRECQKTEEYHKIGDQPPIFHEKSSTTFATGTQQNPQKQITSHQELIQKIPTKIRPPKFISPIIGKIVDQDVDIILEGILDGQPTPQIKWTKNGEDIKEDNRVKTTWSLNKTTLEIKNVTVQDAGRYSCTAVNEGGTAVSTADLVVRKTIFPPVFGRRLQAQVIKKGDRVIMEVEITGTPEPTVTWYKDGTLIDDSMKNTYKIKPMGQSHTLTIAKAEMNHSGRFMVRAVNAGGEAQSIADIAVIEPAPDSMVEVVKTVVFEDIKKHETLASAADQISSVESKPVPVSLKLTSSELSQSSSAKSEVTSTTEQVLSQEKQVIRLEHKVPDIPMPKPIVHKTEDLEISRPATLPKQEEIIQEKKVDVQEGIETSSISTQSSLQFFVKKIKEGEVPIQIQKELPMPEPIKQDIYKKFESAPAVPQKPEPIRQEFHSFTSSQNVEPLQHYESISTSQITKEFALEPEPPAEICYAPKPVMYKKQEVSERIKKISESQKELPPHEVPTGAVKIFPSTQKVSEQKIEKSYQSSYQTSSSSYSRTFESSGTKPTFEEPPWVTERPKSTSSYTSYEKHSLGRPLSAQGEPSQEALMMEKQWAHKFSENHQEKSWPPQHEEIKFQPSWSVQSTLEKKWTPKIELQIPKQHYIAEVSNLGSIVDTKQVSLEKMSKSEYILEESNVRPSEIIKSWPPPSSEIKPFTTIDSLPIRPVSVQDITDEVYLEPGPPPEMAYAPPAKPTIPQRKEWVAPPPKEVPKEWAAPKLPAKHWVAPPPPLPPKQVILQAPPVPAKPLKHAEQPKKILLNDFTPFENFPILDPFPFKPDDPQRPKQSRVGPPPTPSKFIKGKFTDSDYESDFESTRISAKWKPAISDTEEPSYRKVDAPKIHFTKSRSQEPDVLPPSKFEQPPVCQGPPRPEVNVDEFKHVKKLTKHVRDSKRSTFQVPQPSYVPNLVKTPDSPKAKQNTVLDGYMADTEYSKEEYKQLLKTSECTETQNVVQKPRVLKKTQIFQKELVTTPIVTSQVKLEAFPYKPEPEKPKMRVPPPPPSPSRFVKGEFRETDYESDYERRIPPVWGSHQDPSYKPVHPSLTPNKQHGQQYGRTPTPPTEFERHPQEFLPARPKFEPIKPEIKPVQKNVVYKPKPEYLISKKDLILQPGSPPEIGFAPSPKKTQYYKSTVSAPYTNAIQHETSNVVHFNESTENCHRTMSVQQTHKVIKFGDKYKKEEKLEPFPFQAEPERVRRSTSVPPPPTPTKFIPGEFRESDYESEVESAKIKQKWTPRGGEDRNQYRKVRAPAAVRSSSVPAPRDRILSPMDFDTPPTRTDYTDGETRKHESVYRKFTENSNNLVKRSYSHEPGIKPGSPPQYGYANDQRIIKQTASKVATHHMDTMTQAFKTKTQRFVTDIMDDVNKQKTLKNGSDGEAQVYREESRAAQYGTKHVDPDTGLIYFKYDFGYEFGIILPGEGGKQGGVVPTPKKTIIEPPRRTKDIELPVYHEKSTNLHPSPQFKPKKFVPANKSGKWEPTSESEMSDYERDGKGTNFLQGSRWEPSSCSPASLSPSLPSTSPAFNNTFAVSGRPQTPPSCPSTPGSIQGKPINPALARAPMFITPLRDIAVVAGQAAKFECIVQSEPQPNILWSKNGRIIQNSRDYQLHFRNGVCRLTISQAYPEDAGVYACTATNPVGTANTTANLEVPGVPSHMYGTYRQFTTVRRNRSPEMELYKRPESPGNLPFPIGKSSGLHCLLENYH